MSPQLLSSTRRRVGDWCRIGLEDLEERENFGELVSNQVSEKLSRVLEEVPLVFSRIYSIAVLRRRQHYALYVKRRPGCGDAHRNPFSDKDTRAHSWAVSRSNPENGGGCNCWRLLSEICRLYFCNCFDYFFLGGLV